MDDEDESEKPVEQISAEAWRAIIEGMLARARKWVNNHSPNLS